MNILPKKRWHVRTKDNIARVRRDEALAAEEEKKKVLKIKIAEREARTEALRNKARQQYGTHTTCKIPVEEAKSLQPLPNKHINLFYELEQNDVVTNKTNEEHEKEKKLEREKYEKQIGYLTYLGQDTNELTGNVSWYNKAREEVPKEKEEVSKKQKIYEDPLEGMRKYLECEGVKQFKQSFRVEKRQMEKRKRYTSDSGIIGDRKQHKKMKTSKKKKKKNRKKHSSESEKLEMMVKRKPNANLEKLRAERLQREKEERKRADELIARRNGVFIKQEEPVPETIQKYNSQFNPHLAKQNYTNK